jgi:tripartite ATP-independent transporter DctM subunit
VVSFIVVALLFILLGAGMPVGFAMAVTGCIGLYFIGDGFGALIGIVQTSSISTVSAYELITIPMFLLLAEFVLISKIADELFEAAAAWVGRLRGGLGMATALAGAGFGAICGSSAASAATLSATSLPAMLKQGYEIRMATGVVAISGTLAMLIPPSIALIIYAILANVSIGQLLIGGIVPGLIITVTIMLTIWVLVVMDPARAPLGPKVSFRVKLRLLKVVGPMIVLLTFVTGVLYTGITTPTEASALGAFGAFIIAVFRRKLSVKNLGAALGRAARSSCMISMILVGAHIFGYYFTLAQVPQELVAWVGSLDTSRWVIMTMLLIGYIILGCFMDQIAILVLTVPIVLPLIKSLGFDPLWFGIIMIVTAEIGMVTPPMGLNCYIVSRYANTPVIDVFRGIWPHFLAHLVALTILVLFPSIILWLPSKMVN